MEDLLSLSARRQRQLLIERDISAVELMRVHYDQIDALNPTLNAIVNLLPREQAIELARSADAALRSGTKPGALHGLPMAPKDLVDAAGFPTTFGFSPYADRIARADCELTARQRAAGALFIGKTNVPEFGLGSHTFNSLFGTTCNPYDPTRTAGGSSGGAAAALASGMLSIADGSDMGGSLRNPAAFCNVVGLRPSIGRVPDERAFGWYGRLATMGPMARSVADAAWLFNVQAGFFAADPLSRREPGIDFAAPLEADLTGRTFAITEDLGLVPVDREVRSAVRSAAESLESLGARVELACPDLSGAMSVFQVQRAAALSVTGKALDAAVPDWRDHAKDTTIWNIERGFALTADDLINAELQRTQIYREVATFFERFDALVLPSAQVPPFPVETDWIREIDGQSMATYLDWMTVCCAISVTGLPAISIPGGFTTTGLPTGIQMVAGPGNDWLLLQLAHAFEQATGYGQQRPDLQALQ